MALALLFLLVATASGFAPVERSAASAVGRSARKTTATTELGSVPGPFDTLTSGLASIVRIQVRERKETIETEERSSSTWL